jgi:hypothetical protein
MDRPARSRQTAPNGADATPVVTQRHVMPRDDRVPPIVGGGDIAEIHLDVTPLAAGEAPSEHRSGTAEQSTTGRRSERFLHVAVDDIDGWAYAEVLGRAGVAAQAGFALRAIELARRRRIPIRRVICASAVALHPGPLAGRCRKIRVSLEEAESMSPWTRAQTDRFVRAAAAGWAGNAHSGESREWTHTGSGWIAVGEL